MEQGMPRAPALFAALAASFQVYLGLVLVPVAAPILSYYFMVDFWPLWPSGELILGDRKWLSAYAAAVLVLQGGFAVLAYLVLRRPRMGPAVLLGLSVPLVLLATPYLLLHELPLRLAVEADSKPEQRTWSLACEVEGAVLKGQVDNTGLSFEKRGRAWVERSDESGDYLGDGLLSMPDCRVVDRPLDVPPRERWIERYAASGAAFIVKWHDRDDAGAASYLAPETDLPIGIAAPEGIERWYPILSADGLGLAWVEDQEGGGDRVQFRHLDSSAEPMQGPELGRGCSGPDLVAFDRLAEEFLVRQSATEIAVLDRDGRFVWGPVSFGPELGSDAEFHRLDDGWVAWDPGDWHHDEVRSIRRARVKWDLPGGSGLHEVPAGRRIAALSVDPGGSFIALSVAGSYWGSGTRGAVYVLRTADGGEVYRRYAPPDLNIGVAFLGSGYLAMDRMSAGSHGIEVLRLATDTPGS